MSDPNATRKLEEIAIDDIKVAIDREIVSQTIIDAMKRRQYEHVEARIGGWLFDTPEIPSGQRILEVGAGLGFVGSSLFQSGKVEKIVSYEANPTLVPLIRETHRLNGVNSEVRNFLLGADSEGSGSIFVPTDFWAASGKASSQAVEHSVPRASLQAAVDEIQPTFMLIDIEGGETVLFDGISELPSVHSVLIELHQMAIGREGIATFFKKMMSMGFGYDQRYSNGKVVLFQKLDFPMKRK